MRIELYSPTWQQAVLDVANDVLGRGYFERPSEIAAEPGSVMLIGRHKDSLVGFVQGRILPAGDMADFFERRLCDIPPDIADADREGTLGVIQAVAVAPQNWRDGAATKLLTVLHDRLVGLGADKLVIAFKRGQSADWIDRWIEKLGFVIWTRLPSYWRVRCDNGDFRCIHRNGGCTCAALIYRKAVY